jgi:hypothetical protein
MRVSFINLKFIALVGTTVSASSLCPDGEYLHPNAIAGHACYKEGEEEILCHLNTDSLCTETNCKVQLGGFEEYTCAQADHVKDDYYGEHGEALKLTWVDNCCESEMEPLVGCLANKELSFIGECTYEKFVNTAVTGGCTEIGLFAYLGVADASAAQSKVEELCVEATTNAHDSFLKFSDIAKGGYQFDREFMNGGSDWNNFFNPDLKRVNWVIDNVGTMKGISFPDNIYNFDLGAEGNCDSKAAMCCWTADSSDAGEGSCTDPNGCQDAEPVDNTDVCYVDITDSPLASHTKKGIVTYSGDSEGSVNCKGFTWTDNVEDASTLYKGNLLFEVAMRYGLKENGYTRSVPHAPMCACVEQMPVVSNSACVDVEANHTWSFAPDDESGLLKLWQSKVDLVFNDCGGFDLSEHYINVHDKSISHRITGDCAAAEESFLTSHGYTVDSSIQWVKVAGKGAYAEPDNPAFTEQHLDGSHTSMSRNDFEELWDDSIQILMRQCKYCTQTHRYAYIKRYDDDGLPPNVNLLKMVKDEWKWHENNTVNVDFDIFSTLDDALQEKEPWLTVNSDYHNVGFPRDSGPDGYVYNQWNVWETPLHNKHYGQGSVAFYVGIPNESYLESMSGSGTEGPGTAAPST